MKLTEKQKEELILLEDCEMIHFIKDLSDIYNNWYIDGTMFDGGDMVLSCRGVADNEFNVQFAEPDEDMKEYCILINKFRNNVGVLIDNLDELTIWIDNEIIEAIENEPHYNHIQFVFFNLDADKPTIMAQLI